MANQLNRINHLKKTCLVSKWRFFMVIFLLASLFALLVVRIAWLQIIKPDQLIYESDLRSLRIKKESILRGIISDRVGRPLAVSVPVEAICADPQLIHQQKSFDNLNHQWKALSEALKMPMKLITERIDANINGRFVYLSRQVTPEIAKYIQRLLIPGIYLKTQSRRFYPTGEAAAHLIGVTDIDGYGIEGVEKQFNDVLVGHGARRLVRNDAFGRVIEGTVTEDGVSAQNITLSIDERLQLFAYQALKHAIALHNAKSGSMILVDVRSGEILALANAPSYNPNSRMGTPAECFRNRAVTDTFEPGSTVKPFVLLKALENRTIQVHSLIDTTPGNLKLNGHTIRDLRNYGTLTLGDILRKSSNVAMSKIALSMPVENLINLYRDFGFDTPTCSGLIGENYGYLLDKMHWSDLERAGFSFGYGLAVTPLQLARAYATLGSFGIARPLSIKKIIQPIAGKRVANENLVRQIIQLMESVSLPGGGGVLAAIPGYRVAVKTGTTKIAENGKYSQNYVSYTAGIAPASAPRLALVVVICDPKNGDYYGGKVAAPLFSSMMNRALQLLNIAPDTAPCKVIQSVMHRHKHSNATS